MYQILMNQYFTVAWISSKIELYTDVILFKSS